MKTIGNKTEGTKAKKSNEAVFSNDTPTLKTAVLPDLGNEYSAGTIDESMLTSEEQELVNKYVSEIDIANVDQVVQYGLSAQQNISDFSMSVLKKIKTHDLGEIGTSLKELTVALDVTTEPQKTGIMGLFQKAKKSVGAIRANYAKAESNVDRIEKDLRIHQTILVQDISMYQQMYELSVQYYRNLTIYVIAGKKALDKAKKGRLLELKARADLTNMQEDVQSYKDFEDLCYRFSKKVADLEMTRIIAIQSAPQVRMLQNNDREMLDKIQSSISNTIPLWRNQLVISLGVEHSRRALVAQSTLTEKTNDLLRKNSEALKIATIETAKEVEKPIVDIETLRLCNKNLISSVNEVVKIHDQGMKQREKIETELIKIEEELKQTMMNAGKK